MHWLAKGFLDLLFPTRCLACRRFAEAPFCLDCARAVTPIVPPLCHRCGIPFDPQARGGPLCASCRRAPRLPFAIGRSVAAYETPLREAVHRLKYDRKRVLGRVLGDMVADAMLDGAGAARAAAAPQRADETTDDIAQSPAPPQIPFDRLSLIVPVPLHPVRARERGFNQAELLVAPLAHQTGIPMAIDCLQRTKLNAPQVAVPTQLRRANVRGAFAVTDPAAVEGGKLLVFDDVWTTGATLSECARVLRQAGAAEVYLLSLCRAVPHPRV
jgi:ComF family protein